MVADKPILAAMTALCMFLFAIALSGCATNSSYSDPASNPAVRDQILATCDPRKDADPTDPAVRACIIQGMHYHRALARSGGATGTSNPAVLDSYYNTPASRGYNSGATIYCVGC